MSFIKVHIPFIHTAGVTSSKLVLPTKLLVTDQGLTRNRKSFFVLRPAWAHSWRYTSSRELVTVSEVKRNCLRVTECGKEAWSINCEPMICDQGSGGVNPAVVQ